MQIGMHFIESDLAIDSLFYASKGGGERHNLIRISISPIWINGH